MYQKEQSSWAKHIDFAVLDLICMQLAFALGYWIRMGTGVPYRQQEYRSLVIVVTFIQIVAIFFCESFNGVLRRGKLIELKETLRHVTLVILLVFAYMFLTKQSSVYSRIAIVIAWGLYGVMSYCFRLLLKWFLNSRKYSEGVSRSILLVTTGEVAERVIKTVQKNNYRKFCLAGLVLVDSDHTGETIQGIPVVADKENATAFIRRSWVDEVFFAIPRECPLPEQMMKECSLMGIVVHTYLATEKYMGKHQVVENLGGYTVLSTGINMVTPRQLFMKRAMDIAGGLAGCLLTGLVTLFVAPMIKIKSPGPVFFSQTRVGKNGYQFKIYKFRSMYMDAEERKKELMEQNNVKDGLMFKMDDDPRIIKGIGHFIRKTSIDEFPQFWNILKGDMSLVGTRPPTLDEWEKYEFHHRRRLAIKPGLTGMWQVSGRSEITDFEEVVELDTEYISDWSLRLDIKILFKTVMVVLQGSGAK